MIGKKFTIFIIKKYQIFIEQIIDALKIFTPKIILKNIHKSINKSANLYLTIGNLLLNFMTMINLFL